VREDRATGDFARLDPEGTARHLCLVMACFTHPSIVQVKVAKQEQDDLPIAAEGLAEMMLRASRP
jgi:hypothetical protein